MRVTVLNKVLLQNTDNTLLQRTPENSHNSAHPSPVPSFAISNSARLLLSKSDSPKKSPAKKRKVKVHPDLDLPVLQYYHRFPDDDLYMVDIL